MKDHSLRVLVLGSGGREHVLCGKIAESPKLQKLFCAPGSYAISRTAECVALNIIKPQQVVSFCKKNHINLVVIGPEAPLAAGVADALTKSKIACFGPKKAAAQLESSKAFAKQFMERHKIPTATFGIFSRSKEAVNAIHAMPEAPLVVKASGLAGGKGVRVCKNKKEALLAISDFMDKKIFKDAGKSIVIEEALEGPELTAMALLDGKSLLLLPLSRDHKRLLDNNEGPNTGGMGAFSPIWVDPEIKTAIDSIFEKTRKGLQNEKLDYRGVLYCGFMLTKAGPKVLEFNCRFGDPEAQAVLPLIESDLLEFLWATSQKKLSRLPKLRLTEGSSVCVTLASEGYPEKPVVGAPIMGLERAETAALVFHSGTSYHEGVWKTAAGRVLGVTGLAFDISSAREIAYEAISEISFPGMNFRSDIAQGE